jgi:nitrile hydratase accessory protein
MPNDPAHDAAAAAGPAPQPPAAAFSEPWQARAFAITVLASRQGCFTWPEWTRALSRELHAASDAAYFDCWLSALQSLLLGKGTLGPDELRERRRAWEEAYRRTPHGSPVSLIAR